MQIRKPLEYVMQDSKTAILIAFILSFIGPLAWLAEVLLALVTLRRGARQGLTILVACALPDIIMFGLTSNFVYLIDIVISIIFVWSFALMLRATVSWANTLQILAAIGVVFIILVHLFYPNIAVWWQSELTVYIEQLQHQFGHLFSQVTPDVVKSLSMLATGILLTKILFSAFLQVLLARYFQALLYHPNGLREEIMQLRLNNIAVFSLVVCFIAIALQLNVALDILPVLLLPFFIVGVCLMHNIAKSRKMPLMLIVLYLLLIVFFPYVAVLLIMLAVLDSCFNIRKQLQINVRGE